MYFIYGHDDEKGRCFYEQDCEECIQGRGAWVNDDYNFYHLTSTKKTNVPQRKTDADKDLFKVETLQSDWCKKHNQKDQFSRKRTLESCEVTYNGNANFIKTAGNEWTNGEYAQSQTAMFRYVKAEECHPPGHPDEIYQIFQSPDAKTVCGVDSKQPKPNEIVWGGYDGMCLASCGVSASGDSFCLSGDVVVVPCGTSIEARAKTNIEPEGLNVQRRVRRRFTENRGMVGGKYPSSRSHTGRRRRGITGMPEYGWEMLYYPVLDTAWSKRTLTVLPPALKADSADSYLFRENLVASWSISTTRAKVFSDDGSSDGSVDNGLNTGPLRYPKGIAEDSQSGTEKNYQEPIHPEDIFGNNPQALTIDDASSRVKLKKLSKGNPDYASPGYQNFKHTGSTP